MIKKRPRFNYWSCSRLSYWIRGDVKPEALPWGEWDNWHKEMKKNRPIRYWLAEEGLDRLQDIVNFPLDLIYTLRVYIRNRFIDKIQYLKTGLIPGEYYDLDHRMLHGLFNELIDFVECEQAHLMKVYKDRNYKFVKGRCPQAGLDYLFWACNLKMNEDYGITPECKDYGKLTDQAKAAIKTVQLYHWWKNRPNRIDPYSIFTKKKHGKKYYLKISKMEEEYYKEDTKMMIELIKLREFLWT